MNNRSYLFVPGNKPDRFEKARISGVDAVMVDLEDAVPEEEKEAAREDVSSWLSSERPVFVRINAASTPWFDDDLEAVRRPGLAGILLPKAEYPAESRRSLLASEIPCL